MKYILLAFIIITSILFGCASTHTKYEEGIYEKSVHASESGNVRKIGFKGNSDTNNDLVYYNTLVKAAEITINSGYIFFVAFESNYNSDSSDVSLHSGNSLGSYTPNTIEDNRYEMQIYMFKDLDEIPSGKTYHNAHNILLNRDLANIEHKMDTIPPPPKSKNDCIYGYIKAAILFITVIIYSEQRHFIF